jgi:2-polyprenyl-3-methyl-5-hydroxy-6-metoxy-1,4-benzoquinol methylase
MKTREFNSYKSRYRNAIQQVLAQAEPGSLDEAAFPAYSHRNPIINWLFWQRLRKVMEYTQNPAPYANVLDFGCGSGVMLPYLSQVSSQVTAMDVDLLPLESVQVYIPLAANVEIKDAAKSTIGSLPTSSFDLIIALDVLEHVKDLQHTLDELLMLLKQGGQLIISGPTENILYRMGRKVAGPEYSGSYHERGIAEIKSELERSSHIVQIEDIATLYWPIPLFEIFTAKKL